MLQAVTAVETENNSDAPNAVTLPASDANVTIAEAPSPVTTAEDAQMATGAQDIAIFSTIVGTNGNDVLGGGTGDDIIFGLGGTDSLNGGFGNDVLFGNDGNDFLIGGGGNDRLIGGAGADLLGGGDGFDIAAYDDPAATSGVTVDLVNPSRNTGDAAGDIYIDIEAFELTRFNDLFFASDAGAIVHAGIGDDILEGTIEGTGSNMFYGEAGNDQLLGGGGNDILDGGDGDDFVLGGAGNDLLDGGSGADFLIGGSGNDTLRGGNGDDELRGEAGADVLDGGDGFDIANYIDANAGVSIDLSGASATWTGDAQGDTLISIEEIDLSSFADIFRGDANANLVRGGSGDDQLFGRGGNDTLGGGFGNDSLHGDAGDDVLTGAAGADVIDGGDGFDIANYDVSDATAGVTIDLNASSSTWTGAARGDTLISIEEIDLGNFADIFRGDDNANIVKGGGGDDQLFGNGGDDILTGGGGNDSIFGGDGDDIINGASGSDIIDGGAGYDIASYRTAVAGVSIDLTASSSTWTGVAMNDTLIGIEEFDLSDVADVFRGDASDNVAKGFDGNDTLSGGGGQDALYGGRGNDVLAGNLGGDTLTGNEGADIFRYFAVEESQALQIGGVSQQDQISDFIHGEDKIDFSSIDANVNLGGDQVFTFLADPANHTGDWTGLVWAVTDANGITTVFVSNDGDADAEMSINMAHALQLTASDFIL